MKSEPSLAIITTVYNTEQFLDECLNSLLNQTYKNITIILVDDCSKGNVKEIYEQNYKKYKNIIFVRNEINKGLFLARKVGIETALNLKSKPDYIAFLDSDDYVSVDIYSRLIEKAEESNSDIVCGENIELHSDNKIHKQVSLMYSNNYEINNTEELLDNLFKQRGYDFTWWLVWNKIYKRRVIEQSIGDIKIINDHIVMSEDIIYSTIFFLNTKKFTNIHDDYFYYRKEGNGSTEFKNNGVLEIKKRVIDVCNSFEFVKTILSKNNLLKRYSEDIIIWKNNILTEYLDFIKNNIKEEDKKEELVNFINSNVCSKTPCNIMHPNVVVSPFCDYNNTIKKEILSDKIKVVSFDIFDTLITRPFAYPTDIFELMARLIETRYFKDVNLIDFSAYRIYAEEKARQKQKIKNNDIEEINIDQIYDELKHDFLCFKKMGDRIKALEISLEKELCRKRRYTCRLLEFAKKHGKRIVITSDMYLPRDVIVDILQKNGIRFDNLYLSSDVGLCKCTGNLFKFLAKKENVDFSNILHIGDNYYSDYDVPKRLGLNSIYIPKCYDMMAGYQNDLKTSNLYNKVYGNNSRIISTKESLSTLLVRSMLGVSANYLFDNPFIYWNNESDINCNPLFLGYLCVGHDLFGVTRWLYRETIKDGIENLHFIARDGYLVKRSFEIFNEYFKKSKAKLFYSFFNRKTMLPIQMCNSNYLYSLPYDMNLYMSSPKLIIEMLRPILVHTFYEKKELILSKEGIDYNKKFCSIEEYCKFANFIEEEGISKHLLDKYLNKFRIFYDNKFKGKSGSFDVGYSLRVESTLKHAFNYDLKAYYLNTNGNRSQRRSAKYNLEISTYYDYKPLICGGIREILYSEPVPSCVGFDNKFNPIYSTNYFSIVSKGIIDTIQNNALVFINDYLVIFNKYLYLLQSRKNETSLLLNYFLDIPTDFDIELFKTFIHEDDIGQGKVPLIDEWRSMILYESSDLKNKCIPVNYDIALKFANYKMPKRWLIMILTLNLGEIKNRASRRLSKLPITKFFTRGIYRFIRFFYRLLFKRKNKQ